MDAVRPSMQPWRSRRALHRKEQEEQQQRKGTASGSSASPPQHQQQRWRQDKPALSSEKASQPLPAKADRLKPAPALKSSGGGSIPLELLASPSRGLDAGSTFDLTQASTQEAYRDHISERIIKAADQHGKLDASTLFPWPVPGQQAAQAIGRPMMATLTDVLLLVRRLREGCVAAKRADHFAIDVYALSSLLSLLVNDGIQLSSSLPRLVALLFSSGSRLTPDCFAKTLCDLQNLFLTKSTTAASPNEEVDWLTQSLDPRHFLSLHLLWHSTTGGLVERIGGRSPRNSRPTLPSKTIAWNEALYRIQADVHFSNPLGAYIDLSIAVHDCLTRRQPLAMRKLILKQDQCRTSLMENSYLAGRGDSLTMWHRALLIDSIEAMRIQVWSTMERAYKQIPFEKSLFTSNKGPSEDVVLKEDWIERMLLLDTELFPPTDLELRGTQQLSATTVPPAPDEWDQKENEEMYSVRRARLAHFFKSMESPNPSQLLLKCKDILSPNEFKS